MPPTMVTDKGALGPLNKSAIKWRPTAPRRGSHSNGPVDDSIILVIYITLTAAKQTFEL